MTEIRRVQEGKNIVIPNYSGRSFTEDEIERGYHRSFVSGAGGRWEEDGKGQLAFLQRQGLRPNHVLVDIGCGALRAARHFVEFLESSHYYGVDANYDLVSIGYNRELTPEQRTRLPVDNLRVNDRFNVDFGIKFDMAIAQSVFTHVSFNHMRLCLYRLAREMKPGGVFYASYFEQPEGTPPDHIFQKHPRGRTYFYEKNIYWYLRSDLVWAAKGLPWEFRYVGDYGSQQGQVMGAFVRLPYENMAPGQTDRARQGTDFAIIGGPKSLVKRARRKIASLVAPQ